METEFATFEGRITDPREIIAWDERRQYLELATKYGGYQVERHEVKLDDARSGLMAEPKGENQIRIDHPHG